MRNSNQGALNVGGASNALAPNQEIMGQVNDLSASLDQLDQALTELGTTLLPISVEVKEGAGMTGRPYPATDTPLGSRLQTLVQRADTLREYINGVHARIRL